MRRDGLRGRLRRWRGDAPVSERYIKPEEACARTGLSVDELRRTIPYFQSSPRMLRFRESYVDALVTGTFSLTLHYVDRDFAELQKKLGLIYFIEAVGTERVKIGFTTNPVEYRLRRLQTSSPFALSVATTLEGSLGHERYLHKRYASERIIPTAEWFHLRGGVADLVEFVRTKRRWP